VLVTATFDEPASWEITFFDVQKGASQRSFIQFLDVTFNLGAGMADLIASINDADLTNDRIQLRRFELDGSGPGDLVDLADRVGAVDQVMEFDFGPAGIGGDPNASIGDGYYELAFDLDGNGTLETDLNFYRLAGDANGDGAVDSLDLLAINAAYGTAGSNLDADVNGDGVVNIRDRMLAYYARGRSLGGGLWLDD
jgi:hypothetical protein